MRKTLIIFGSSRRNGFTMKMVQLLCDHLDGEVELINCYREYKNIKPCVDCRYCWTTKGCAIDDRATEIYEKIEQADNIVLASPLYFHCITGPMKVVVDRLQMYWAGTRRKDKPGKDQYKRNGAYLLCGGAPSFPNQFVAGEIVCEGVLGDTYCNNLGSVKIANTDRIVWEEQTDTHDEIIALAKRLNGGKNEVQL